MISLKYLLQICIIYLTLNVSISSRTFSIRWTRTNCSIIDKYTMMLLECSLKELPYNRGNVITVEVKFNHNVNKSLVDFKAAMRVPGKSKDTELLNFRVDGCKMANHKTGNPAVNAMVKKMVQVGNVHKGCPLRKNLSYKLENFALNPDYFPSITPEINFTTSVKIFSGKTYLFYVIVEASIVKKNKVKSYKDKK